MSHASGSASDVTSSTTSGIAGGTAVHGHATGRFAAVRERFQHHLRADPGHSAQIAAYVDGELVVDLWGGPRVTRDSVTGVFSASKGVAALTLALLVQRGDLSLDAPVTAYWPEFAEGDPVRSPSGSCCRTSRGGSASLA